MSEARRLVEGWIGYADIRVEDAALLRRLCTEHAALEVRLTGVEAEVAALKEKLADAEAVVKKITIAFDFEHKAFENAHADRQKLKAQVADAEREAVERERKAWDEAVEWAHDCERHHVAGRWFQQYVERERDGRYPLPEEEGR